jgi:hypothetical protein
MFLYRATSLRKDIFFSPHFTAVDYGLVWMEIRGYINHLSDDVPTDVRMRVPPPVTRFA